MGGLSDATKLMVVTISQRPTLLHPQVYCSQDLDRKPRRRRKAETSNSDMQDELQRRLRNIASSGVLSLNIHLNQQATRSPCHNTRNPSRRSSPPHRRFPKTDILTASLFLHFNLQSSQACEQLHERFSLTVVLRTPPIYYPTNRSREFISTNCYPTTPAKGHVALHLVAASVPGAATVV
jgi:hypothetical protein